MSEKKSKQKRKDNPNVIMINRNEFVGKDQVIAYLLDKMKALSGYKFISIGPVGSLYKDGPNKNVVLITAHWSLPAMQTNGRYMSDRDKTLDAMQVDDPEFKGIVIDRFGHGIIGNPFAPIASEDVPSLGEESAKPAEITDESKQVTDPCAADAKVESL